MTQKNEPERHPLMPKMPKKAEERWTRIRVAENYRNSSDVPFGARQAIRNLLSEVYKMQEELADVQDAIEKITQARKAAAMTPAAPKTPL